MISLVLQFIILLIQVCTRSDIYEHLVAVSGLPLN